MLCRNLLMFRSSMHIYYHSQATQMWRNVVEVNKESLSCHAHQYRPNNDMGFIDYCLNNVTQCLTRPKSERKKHSFLTRWRITIMNYFIKYRRFWKMAAAVRKVISFRKRQFSQIWTTALNCQVENLIWSFWPTSRVYSHRLRWRGKNQEPSM